MKIKKKFILLSSFIFSIFLLTACTNLSKNSIENFYGKDFLNNSGSIHIIKKTDDYSCVIFDDASVDKSNSKVLDDVKIETFDYPKIISKGEKSFLIVKGIDENRFEFKTENVILDTKTNEEYKLHENEKDINRKDIKNFLGKEYYTNGRDGYIKFTNKTRQYYFVDLKIPRSYFTETQIEENKKDNVFIYSGKFDFPKISLFDDGTQYLNADGLEKDRFKFIENDNQILDTYTRFVYYLDENIVVKK